MNKIINVMPMAGIGKRFQIENYKLPKPLIKINKKPMFIQAFKSMPKSSNNIFICHKKLVKNYKIKSILKNNLGNNFKIVTVSKLTNGQAGSCIKSEKYLKKDENIFVHSCDSLINFNKKKFNELLKKSDAIILTTKPNKIHLSKINSYGWVSIRNKKITKITCKKKASLNPSKDKVIIGTFAFRTKKIFLNMIKNLFKSKKKINNEYYIDMAFSHALKNKINIQNFTVNSYCSWGTPDELKKWEKTNYK